MSAGGLPIWLAVLLAVATFLLAGGASLWIGLATLAGLALPRPSVGAPGWIALHVLALVTAGLLAAFVGYREGLGALVGWLLVHRRWVGSSASDARLALLLATLLALLGCLQSETMTLGALLIAFVGVLPAALLRVEGGQASGLGLRGVVVGVVVLTLGAGLYLVLPRMRGGYFAEGGGVGGLGATVTLGDDEGVTSDQIVARFRVSDSAGNPVPGPHYLRGRILDEFDGRVWYATLRAPGSGAPLGEGEHRAVVDLEPIAGGVVFGPPEIVGVRGVRAWSDEGGVWRHAGGIRSVQYEVLSRWGPALEPPLLDARLRAAYLALPTVSPAVRALAWSVEPDSNDPRRVAAALSAYLASEYLYVGSPPSPEGDPISWFLFESRRGHCEYFATALAVLLRVRDIPARLSTGFYTPELGELPGEYVARASHAHAWVEVPLASGWTRFDPSPLEGGGLAARPWWDRVALHAQDRWSQFVVDFDLGDQFSGLDALGQAFARATGRPEPALPARSGARVLLTGLAVLYALAVVAQVVSTRVLVARSVRATGALAGELARARRLVARRGWVLPRGMPALAAADWLCAMAGEGAQPFRELALLVYDARYGRGGDLRREAARCLSALASLPRAPLRT